MKFAAPVPLVIWSVFLGSLATILAVWSKQLLPPILLGAAAVCSLAIAVYLALRGAMDGGHKPSQRWLIPDMSFATALLAAALVCVCVGAVIGFWLVLVGAGMSAFGLFGVGRELYTSRQLSQDRPTDTQHRR